MIKLTIAFALIAIASGAVGLTGEITETTPIALIVMVAAASLTLGCAVGAIFEAVRRDFESENGVLLLTHVHDV